MVNNIKQALARTDVRWFYLRTVRGVRFHLKDPSQSSCIAFTLACMEMEAFSTGKAEEPKPRKNKHTNNNKKHTYTHKKKNTNICYRKAT